MRTTARQLRTAALYASGKSQSEVGKMYGVTQQAISMRLKRFAAKLSPEQLRRYQRGCRSRYARALTTQGRRVKIRSIKV